MRLGILFHFLVYQILLDDISFNWGKFQILTIEETLFHGINFLDPAK